MARLMPAASVSLTLPLAARARLSRRHPQWLRECLAAVQEDYLSVRFSAQEAHSREQRECLAHETEAVREMLVDAWLDALCPLPVFHAPAQGQEARN